jgi:pyruvate/2-oxoglutarate dehydrogenase complex dihydrolipoamide dehydrogenase (E3) component
MPHYQNLIIGSGEGGKFLSWHLASSGQPTAVVERRWIGGSCPNINCLPSKNEIHSAKVIDFVRHAAHFGAPVPAPKVDMAAVRKRKRDMVAGLVQLHFDRYKSTGVHLFMGSAKFTAPLTVQVQLNEGGAQTLTADRIFLNLGTHATIPPTPGLAESRPLTNIELLELDRLPDHLVVLGGGFVGLEFAQACRRFGSKVTIIQHGPQLLPNLDPEIVAELASILTDEGITILTSTELTSVQGASGSSVTLTLKSAAKPSTLAATDILVATGRTPNTANIGLDIAGVKLDPRGYIHVNDRLQTSAPNVWAIGECAGSPQFTHVSFDDFRVIRDNLAGKPRSTQNRLVPSCLFTDPPLAHVGLTESEAIRRNIPYRLLKTPMPAVLRTRTLDETRGFMKALIDPQSLRILGFTMLGPEAGEVLATIQTAILANQPCTLLADAILTHPTMAEGLTTLFANVPA